MLRFRKIPYLTAVLTVSVLWGIGSGYWYVCKTQDVCNPEGTKEQIAINNTFDTLVEQQEVRKQAALNDFGADTTDETTVSMPSPVTVYFQPDSDKPIDETWQDSLDEIYEYLDKNPGSTLLVAGYAANVPSPVDGVELSTNRARNVAGTLVDAKYDESRITISTKGYEDQIGNNLTQEDRKMNRRAIISIVSNEQTNNEAGGF